MNTKPELPDLSGVLDVFASTPDVTASEVAKIAEANAKLDSDPKFLADVQKARVAQALRGAMEKRGETISSFAARWEKTKQYVSRILNLEHKTNFTLETITEAAVLLGLRATVQIHRPDQEVVVRSRRSCRAQYKTRARAVAVTSGKFPDDASGNHAYPLAA